jgi:hypothetical protein
VKGIVIFGMGLDPHARTPVWHLGARVPTPEGDVLIHDIRAVPDGDQWALRMPGPRGGRTVVKIPRAWRTAIAELFAQYMTNHHRPGGPENLTVNAPAADPRSRRDANE